MTLAAKLFLDRNQEKGQWPEDVWESPLFLLWPKNDPTTEL
jgi:hypothetical protein